MTGTGTKQSRRDAARRRAQEERLRADRARRRTRAAIQVGVGLAIVAVLAVVALVIATSARPDGGGPRNMADGGVAIEGATLSVVRTGAPAPGATPTARTAASGGRVLIQAYEDFGCPDCQAFEARYASTLQSLVRSGAAVVEYHPVAILDTHFTDDSYSTRAANAAAAVVNWSPKSFPAFHALLYTSTVQPEEGGPGLSDDRLIALARQVGAIDQAQIAAAIRSQRFAGWIQARTAEFLAGTGSLRGVRFPASRQGPGTPTVVVDGHYWDPSRSTLGSFVTSVGGSAG